MDDNSGHLSLLWAVMTWVRARCEETTRREWEMSLTRFRAGVLSFDLRSIKLQMIQFVQCESWFFFPTNSNTTAI